MRTQEEILTKIHEITKDKSDPSTLQWNILVRKLSWDNVVKHKFINPKYIDDEHKKKWKLTNLLDKEIILKQLESVMDTAANDYFDKDHERVFLGIQALLIYIWLLGMKYDPLLAHLWNEYMFRFQNDYGYRLFRIVCAEFEFSWEIYKLRYCK